ncbi:APC family permease [Actinomycetospora sp. NBRC 106375]|uniref:APC family permease n=1 Tax=Actinomycetospora sp. NBRC 106375 TaxID=3032207 RepID=UPI0025562F55|nr:APC family permease [Actinomycetospora sp. NBRC 106375]
MTRIPGLRSRSPVAGLRRRALRPLGVFAQSVATTAPAGAMASVPLLVIAVAGPGAPVSFAVAAVVVGLVAICIAVFARRMAAAGGLYSFTAQGLGSGGAFACAVSMVVSYGMLVAAAFTGVSWYGSALLSRLWPAAGTPVVAAALAVVLAAVVAVCALRGIRLAGRVMLVIESVSIVVILAVLVTLAITTVPAPVAAAPAVPGGALGIALGVLPALAAFIGFDSATALGVEARRPFASVPRAVTATAAVTAVLYLVATLVQLAAPGAAVGATSPSSGQAGGLSGAAVLMDLGIVASFGACALAALNTLVRVLFSLARDGVAPAVLGRTHRRYLTPAVAIAIAVPVLAVVAITGGLAGVAPAAVFSGLLSVGTLAFLVTYVLVCLAAPRFLARIGELTRGVVVAAVLAVAALVATLVVVLLNAGAALLLTLAGLVVVAAAGWFVLRRRRPVALRTMGVYDETTTADVLTAGSE